MRAYTLGYTKGYDASLAKATVDKPVRKLGKRDEPGDEYGGGWVWPTQYGARMFLYSDAFAQAFPGRSTSEFAVYRLELPNDWKTDTTGPESDGVHRLVNDAVILGRVFNA